MAYRYSLLGEVLGKRQRPITDRQMNAQEIARTARFMECQTCGDTWPADEDAPCECE